MEIEIIDADPRRIKNIRIRGLDFEMLLNKGEDPKKNNSDIPLAP
jgi:hypothetical protein